MSFLKAEWRKLILVNYAVDEKVLLPFLPHRTELDKWQGKAYVSLVGFMFLNTKVKGIKIPFHVNFEEVNLRFYVKHFDGDKWKRGVVFIKEIVPKSAITFVANTVYKENYETMHMTHDWKETADYRTVTYVWGDEPLSSVAVRADLDPAVIEVDSEEEFITEHYWGYAKVNAKKTHEYEVKHPRWEHYPIQEHSIHLDFGDVYGESFAILNDKAPESVMLAEGSEISVEDKNVIQ